ncbi:hypothetical protein C461_03257 [Halorubrum aidingense JCM 13560]|uniref:Uncharacterized protein n=1 Tax=Halorubrum aidingense JCM 13560 TaxID=1230454 RepID=M0PK87_9EURY|nr:hypothetical protein [Halorubrum aidingense]EMA69160.1 hypothetical protein C461_03257 [Halorubrum aidingense JCM 13560]
MPVEIDPSVPGEKWRYACPRGHTDWVLRDGAIACRSCPHWRVPGTRRYDVLIDQQTGREIDVEEVRVQ